MDLIIVRVAAGIEQLVISENALKYRVKESQESKLNVQNTLADTYTLLMLPSVNGAWSTYDVVRRELAALEAADDDDKFKAPDVVTPTEMACRAVHSALGTVLSHVTTRKEQTEKQHARLNLAMDVIIGLLASTAGAGMYNVCIVGDDGDNDDGDADEPCNHDSCKPWRGW